MSNNKKLHCTPFIRFLFLTYAVFMIWLLFLQRMENGVILEENWNFVPFKTLKLYWRLLFSGNHYYAKQAVVNLAGNVIMFIPLGYFLPAIWLRYGNFWRLLLISVCIIVIIETTQYFTGLGSCDVDDFLLNLPGIIIGFLIWAIAIKTRI